jgi:hypothetical protein
MGWRKLSVTGPKVIVSGFSLADSQKMAVLIEKETLKNRLSNDN